MLTRRDFLTLSGLAAALGLLSMPRDAAAATVQPIAISQVPIDTVLSQHPTAVYADGKEVQMALTPDGTLHVRKLLAHTK